jgi:hypothetical protein
MFQEQRVNFPKVKKFYSGYAGNPYLRASLPNFRQYIFTRFCPVNFPHTVIHGIAV